MGPPNHRKCLSGVTPVKDRMLKESGVKPEFESGIFQLLVWDLTKFLTFSEYQCPYFNIPYFLNLLKGLNEINYIKALSTCLAYAMLTVIIIMPHHGSTPCRNSFMKANIYMQRKDCAYSCRISLQNSASGLWGKGRRNKGCNGRRLSW